LANQTIRTLKEPTYCGECGYNLQSLPARHQCPECGSSYEVRPHYPSVGIFDPDSAVFPLADVLSMLLCIAALVVCFVAMVLTASIAILICLTIYTALTIVLGTRAIRRVSSYITASSIVRRIERGEDRMDG